MQILRQPWIVPRHPTVVQRRLNPAIAVSCLFVALLANAAPRQKSTPQAVPDSKLKTIEDPEEYEVWSALLLKKYGVDPSKELVIVDRTIGSKTGPFTGLTYGLTHTGSKPPTGETELGSDFESKGANMSLLETKFDSKLKYLLVPEARLKEVFGIDLSGKSHSDGWQHFHEVYPAAAAIFAVSRVAFNLDRNQALVFVIRKGGGLNGSGVSYLMTKRGGSWDVEKAVMIWIS
jgi:hypothetical protein